MLLSARRLIKGLVVPVFYVNQIVVVYILLFMAYEEEINSDVLQVILLRYVLTRKVGKALSFINLPEIE